MAIQPPSSVNGCIKHLDTLSLSLCVLVLSRVICLIFWLLMVLLYLSVCVSIYVVHYFIAFWIHSMTTVKFHHMSCVNTYHQTLFIQSECFVQPFTDEGGCIVTETSELLSWRSWLIYLATQDSTNISACVLWDVFGHIECAWMLSKSTYCEHKSYFHLWRHRCPSVCGLWSS